MKKIELIGLTLPIRRGLRSNEAAVYLGISPSTFVKLVGLGKIPGAKLVGSVKVWDIAALDAWFHSLPFDDGRNDQHQGIPSPRLVREDHNPWDDLWAKTTDRSEPQCGASMPRARLRRRRRS